ncbi:MAG TPA: GntR family transcriptional regulator [Spirochaetia bacterium]|nr:GntR family transcriptional regulator [Spirochaetia bacterium]
MERTIPRYLWVHNSLKNQIEIGEYKVGENLPPEPELQKAFRVSRTTVRKAVEMLAQDGFVYIRQGRGTEILDFKATQKLQYVTSFSETLREKGFTVSQADVRVDITPGPRHITEELKTEAGAPLVRIERVTLANGVPIALMTNYLVPELAPGIEKKVSGMDSLYSFLESEYHIVIEAATDYISARQSNAEEARRLQIPRGAPLLVVRRITHSGGRPVEVAILLVIADRYEYCVHTRDRPRGRKT